MKAKPSVQVKFRVKVKFSSGTYLATLGKIRSSSAQSALVAVERVVGKYTSGTLLAVTSDPKCIEWASGHETWEFVVGLREKE